MHAAVGYQIDLTARYLAVRHPAYVYPRFTNQETPELYNHVRLRHSLLDFWHAFTERRTNGGHIKR
jgi:hypothetical protein